MKEISKEGGPRAARKLGSGRQDADGAPPRSRRSRGKRSQYALRRGIVVVVAVACFLFAGFALVDLLAGDTGIQSGVRIGDVDVGGMTKEEARAAVEKNAAETFREISFGEGQDAVSMNAEELGVKVNARAAVDEAYALGRTGGPFARLSDAFGSSVGGTRIDLKASYDEGAARSAIGRIAGDFNQEPKDATFTVAEGGDVKVQPAENGRTLDKEATLANLQGALTNMSGRVPLAEGPAPKPQITTAEIQQSKPERVIGEYQTDFLWDSNPNRKENMKLAAGAINNTVVKPGEVFSFNDLASELDYKEAKTFSDGGVGFANGGGLCQVSSTLYMAAQYAGLEIEERHPHYAVLPYIKPGFDATVWFGDEYGYGVQDMKFRNTTDAPILIREWVDEKGFLNAQILGQPTGKKVEMATEKIFEDTTRGIRWDTYKTVTENGEVTFDDMIHTYTYSYNPPPPEDGPHYDTSAPRVSGWNDPGNTTGWAEVPE
ncbi:MAG: Vancomycin B-type resistance protein VanW [uncultured Rubrobacteraceae bacterium]|uniref:Vancomycin B-type resistance protein VanW n=1 Tax=uncultured Rubrobacteraceae bacterium TaxID=349277 RepID=A0A6J4P901_9ACTN|nr:MAG: Vancomycin B-type resistance protein VanW [uncultured Rubrobacteraceae bacterium]